MIINQPGNIVKHNLKFGLMALRMSAVAADGAASGTGDATAASAAPAAGTPVPDSNAPAVAAKTPRAPKNPDNILDIINGRLPLALVHMIRFGEDGAQTAALAKKYGTSVGKVFDIKKGRNFGYITKDYKPSADEAAAAKAWCETMKTAKGKTLKEAGGDPDAIMSKLSAMGVATAEEVAARNWNIRVVGQAAAVAAGEAPSAAAAQPAETAVPKADGEKSAPKSAAKLF